MTGYQVRYSKKSNMGGSKIKTVSGAKKSRVTLKNLKNRVKYYVQVRTYKKVGGKKYYSAWSRRRSVTVRWMPTSMCS